ncbi:ankyrin repeat domain-containing protein [Candidatus Chromulinivorax destructor]|uniref:Uncharacterized protein n=1 Tax=Candidatus Chromulinivorax destructor TaxID=2066483 RepID=A0A345ZA96_9BACT|nr:ankyrin repeat domain-containing protein [Candidatus Chromulinivorax destructor]AXK60213.1 hypothetical protein C0J27_00410 [Candidatus Chromulinivorax destructor]
MKKIYVAVWFMFGLQSMSMQAAQDSLQNVENGRQAMINNSVKNLTYLTQGFDFLRTQNLVDISFHDFLEQHVSHDEDGNKNMNFDQVILDAEDVLTKNMKDTFLKTLDTSLQNWKNLDQCNSQVFLYVMQNKDDNFYRFWLYAWSKTTAEDGKTQLYRAIFKYNLEIARMLIAAGADVNTQNEDGWTPLYRAVFNNNTEIARMLIAASADVNIQNKCGYTPLHHGNSVEIARMLINAGADVNIQNECGYTALHQAALKNNLEIVSMLIDAGADVNTQNKDGWTPLHYVVMSNNSKSNNPKVAHILISACADVNISDESGYTPLHYAVLGNDKKLVKILIIAGADVNTQNKDGWTPLHKAALNNYIQIVEILITAQAHLNIQNEDGKTAELAARTPEMKEIFAQAREKQHEKMDVQSMVKIIKID